LNFWEAGMHGGTPTDRDPSPAARVGYHSGNGLATTLTRRIDATLGCFGSPACQGAAMAERQMKKTRRRLRPAAGLKL
jgi:hypothetical protein